MGFTALSTPLGMLFRWSLFNRELLPIRCRLGAVLSGLLLALSMLWITWLTLPVAADPRSGQVFQSWQINCDKRFDANQTGCYLYQELFLKKNRKLALRVAIGVFGKDQKLALVFTLPLGILLSSGATMQVDQNQPVNFNLQYCTLEEGCVGVLSPDRQSLDALDLGQMIHVTFYDQTEQSTTLSVSLRGFSEGIRELFN